MKLSSELYLTRSKTTKLQKWKFIERFNSCGWAIEFFSYIVQMDGIVRHEPEGQGNLCFLCLFYFSIGEGMS